MNRILSFILNTVNYQLSAAQVYALAREGAEESADLVTKSHLSLTGASGKVGLYYDAHKGTKQTGHIPA